MSSPREISQRELRNESGVVMRAVGRGESFIVTSNGLPVASLTPIRERYFTTSAVAVAAFRSAPPVDRARFRIEVDELVDQDTTPRA